MDKYHQLLDKLRRTEPAPARADELTDRVMQRVAQLIPAGRSSRAMRISGILSGVAASALICLLVYETVKYPASATGDAVAVQSTVFRPAAAKKYAGIMQGLTLEEKDGVIKGIIRKKEAQRALKERRYASLASILR